MHILVGPARPRGPGEEAAAATRSHVRSEEKEKRKKDRKERDDRQGDI